jgi:hypothetical protein
VKSKKKLALRDSEAIEAARELIKQQRERLGAERNGVKAIVTGIPRKSELRKLAGRAVQAATVACAHPEAIRRD